MALRPEHLGRAVAVAIAALLLVLPCAALAEGRVFLVPVGEGLREPAERRALDPLLGNLGFRQVSWVELADIESRVGLISIVDLRADEACGGTVALTEWSDRLAMAQEQVQLLAPDKALAELSALSLDAACLAQVPRQVDLVLLALVTAEAHDMAAATVRDAGIQLYHRDEVQHALEVAAGFGPDLPPPSWLKPEFGDQLRAHQSRFALGDTVPAYFGGSARGLWLDGKQITTGFRRLTPGQHLIQATWGKDVVAASFIHLLPGRRTIVRVTPGELAVEPEELILELHRLASGAPPAALLADLLGLLAEDADDALILGLGSDGPMLWGRGRGGVVLRYPGGDLELRAVSFQDVGEEPAPPPRERPPALPWTLGAGPALLWTDLGGRPIEGLGGLCGGLALQGRFTLLRPLALAATFHPVARVEALPPGYDASWLWRAMIPVRAGVRVGVPVPRVHVEGGLDAGLLYLGRFRNQELRGLGIGALGLFVPLAPRFGLRLELWAGAGSGFFASGLQLAGEGHPSPPPPSES